MTLMERPEVVEILEEWSQGDPRALDDLLPLVLEDLRGLARSYLARERPGHTLQPTALVHEAYLRLVGRRKLELANRLQLFSTLAETMRRILVDHARRKKAARHGGGLPPIPIDEVLGVAAEDDTDLVELDAALCELETFAPRQHRAIVLSYFAGLTVEEISQVLEISTPTVKRDLKSARVWLFHALRQGGDTQADPEV